MKPNQDIKFGFKEEDPTQIFHLNLENLVFEQIRIILKPETYRRPLDNVKMFVNFGLEN